MAPTTHTWRSTLAVPDSTRFIYFVQLYYAGPAQAALGREYLFADISQSGHVSSYHIAKLNHILVYNDERVAIGATTILSSAFSNNSEPKAHNVY